MRFVLDLTRMYKLLSRISKGLEPLKTTFEKHVTQVGKQAIQQVAKTAVKDPQQYVETILKVKCNLITFRFFLYNVRF